MRIDAVDRAAAALALTLLCGGVASCGNNRPQAPTSIARNELFSADVPEYDEYFTQVHALQLALNEFERARLDVLSRLGLDLGLLEGAELDAVASEVRRRATALDDQGVALNVEYETFDETVQAVASATQSAPIGQYEARARLDVGAEGAELPADGRVLLDALRRSLRTFLGLRARMLAIAAAAPRMRAHALDLKTAADQRVPAGRRTRVLDEVAAAAEFLSSVPDRARANAQMAEQALARLSSSASGR